MTEEEYQKWKELDKKRKKSIDEKGNTSLTKEENIWYNSHAKVKAEGGHLFADEGQMNEEAPATTGFGTWTAEDAAYNPDYDERFKSVNWQNLFNYLLYNPQEVSGSFQNNFGATQKISNTIFDRLNKAVAKTYEDAEEQCMANALNWQRDMAPLWGVPSLRSLMTEHYRLLPQYEMNSVQFDDNHKKTNVYQKDAHPNSWNLARSIAGLSNGADIGTVINIADYLNGRTWNPEMYLDFPIGTIFNIGNATRPDKRYIRKSEYGTTDEFGNLYPSHTYTLATAIQDKNSGKLVPMLNDAQGRLWSDEVLYKGQAPIYAIIPKGSEHLTMANILPRFKQFQEGFKKINQNEFDFPEGGTAANERFVRFIDYQDLDRLRKRYGIDGDLTPIMQRLFAIGAHESNLDNDLNDERGIYSQRNLFKHWMPDFGMALIKDSKRGYTPLLASEEELDQKQEEVNNQHDVVPAYKREMTIYNNFKKMGLFDGKTPDEIVQLVKNEYNRQKEIWGQEHMINGEPNPNFGKLPYNVRTISSMNRKMSKGPFQMKPAEIFYRYDENGNPIPGSESSVDDEYSGEKETLQAANRFFHLMKGLKIKYPDLNRQQLLDAATIAWNAPSKLQDPDFINFYIRHHNLGDNYLDQVIQRQHLLYGDEYRGADFKTSQTTPLISPDQTNKDDEELVTLPIPDVKNQIDWQNVNLGILQNDNPFHYTSNQNGTSNNTFADGGEPRFTQSLSSLEQNNINQSKYRNLLPEVRYNNGGHLFDGLTESTQQMNDTTRVAKPVYIPELGEVVHVTGGTPVGDFGQWAGQMLEQTPDWIPFQQQLRGLGQYLQTDLPTEEEQYQIEQQQRAAAQKRAQEHPYASAAIAGLQGFNDGVNVGIWNEAFTPNKIPSNTVQQQLATLGNEDLTHLNLERFDGTPFQTMMRGIKRKLESGEPLRAQDKRAIQAGDVYLKKLQKAKEANISYDRDAKVSYTDIQETQQDVLDLLNSPEYQQHLNAAKESKLLTPYEVGLLENNQYRLTDNVVAARGNSKLGTTLKERNATGLYQPLGDKIVLTDYSNIGGVDDTPFINKRDLWHELYHSSEGGINTFQGRVRQKFNEKFRPEITEWGQKINDRTTLQRGQPYLLDPAEYAERAAATLKECKKHGKSFDQLYTEINNIAEDEALHKYGQDAVTFMKGYTYESGKNLFEHFLNVATPVTVGASIISNDNFNKESDGGTLSKYSKGTEHDLSNEEVFDLIKKGYKISYL